MDLPAFVSRTIRSRPEGESCAPDRTLRSIFSALERKREGYTHARRFISNR